MGSGTWRSNAWLKRGREPSLNVLESGELAYVTSGTAGTLELRTARTGRRRSSTRIPGGSYNVQPGANRILTPSLGHGTLTFLDHAGRVLASPQVARQAHDACIV